MPENEREDSGTATQAARTPRRQREVGSDDGAGGMMTSSASGARSPGPAPGCALLTTGGGGQPAEDQPVGDRDEALFEVPDAGAPPPLTAESDSESNSDGEATPDSKQGPRTPATGRKSEDQREKDPRRDAARLPGSPTIAEGVKRKRQRNENCVCRWRC